MQSQSVAVKLLILLALLLLGKVWIAIFSNYWLYFPPNFEHGFLQGRIGSFEGLYRWAFYTHIIAGPISIVVGTILLFPYTRRTASVHRLLGRIQLSMVLLLLAPSGFVMAWQSHAGLIAAVGFASLSVATAYCALQGWRLVRLHQYEDHSRWMKRSYVLLCSAIFLRLIGGATELMQLDSEMSYRFAAWASWALPLLAFEVIERVASQKRRPVLCDLVEHQSCGR
jgi:uncharacterized membrane protein YozB (DUF420 family)